MPEVDCELYKLIETGGADAIEFLQGQLTQDLKLLAGDSQLLAAWCNPKGRVFVSLRLVRMDEATGLIVPSDMAERVVQRLTMYRLRSRVDIGQPSDDWTTFVDSDHADPGALIRAGVPTIDANNSEQFTPHMLNLDKLDAISFTKGCYTGQEVVARTEHLGKSKRRLMYYVADRDGIGVGDKLSDGDKNVGEVVNVAERGLLAVTPVELHGQILSAGNTQVVPQGLPYEV